MPQKQTDCQFWRRACWGKCGATGNRDRIGPLSRNDARRHPKNNSKLRQIFCVWVW